MNSQKPSGSTHISLTAKLKNMSQKEKGTGQYRDPWHTGRVGIDPTRGEHRRKARRRHTREGARVGAAVVRERKKRETEWVWGEPPRTPSVLIPLEAAVVPLLVR